ncbi:peptidoglycan DD-metalloendopeptidase family protein [Clostridiaceae bacterium M8S5]|nr:peptidoglycan DD-metalloendopeptidase family protein [Clostridiaceae bacterium M8S5]
MKKKIAILTAVIMMFIALDSISYDSYAGNSINSLKNKLNNTNSEIKKLEKSLKQNEAEKKKVANEIKRLDLNMDKAQEELEIVEAELKKVQGEIEVTKGELAQAEDNILKKKDVLKQRVRATYINGNLGYLEVLLGAKDFGDLLSRLDMVQYIMKQDKELLGYMKEQKEIIEDKKKELVGKEATLTVTKTNVKQKKSSLMLASRQKEQIIAKLKDSNAQLEKELNTMERQAKELDKLIASQMSKAKYSGGVMHWPVEGYFYVTSKFGMRKHPVLKRPMFHSGVDLRAPQGTSILAANDGVVAFAGYYGTYGKLVIIDHGGKIATAYAHNSRLLVKKGQKVKKGQVISKSGSTGRSKGAHLHFEVRKNGDRVNPINWIK